MATAPGVGIALGLLVTAGLVCISVIPATVVHPCNCPAFELVTAFAINDDGECLAYRLTGTDEAVYRFDGNDMDNENMQSIDILTSFPDTSPLLISPNLLPPPGNYPGGLNEVTACIWHAPSDAFLVSSFDDTLYTLDADGQNTTVVGSTGLSGITIRGYALVGGRLFGVDKDSGEIYEFDPDTGATIGSPVQATDVNSVTVRAWAMDWDPRTQQTYIAYSRDGDSNMVRTIGRIDLTTGVIQEGCLAGTHAINSMTFDRRGRLWLSTGQNGPNPSSLFTMERAPCY